MDRRRLDRRHRHPRSSPATAAKPGRPAEGFLQGRFPRRALLEPLTSDDPAFPVQRDSAALIAALRHSPRLSRRAFRRRRYGRRAPAIARAITDTAPLRRRWSGLVRFRSHQRRGHPAQRQHDERDHEQFRNVPDNFEMRKLGKKIGPEHIMASGALPPESTLRRNRRRAFLGWRHRPARRLDYVLDAGEPATS